MITLRTANEADLPILLEFEQCIIEAERPFCPPMQESKFNYYELAELMKKEDVEVIVAEADGELVASGYIEIRNATDYHKHEKVGYLGFMYVVPQWRGKGLNKQIMDELMRWGDIQGVQDFVLTVFSSNDSAIRAYEKVGFEPLLTEMILSKPR